MDGSSLAVGQERSIPGEGILSFEGEQIRKAFGLPQTVELAISFGVGVSSSMVANWLYAKLKGRASRLRIDRREIEIEEGVIKRIIDEHIEQDR